MQIQKFIEGLPCYIKGPAGLCGAIVGHFANQFPTWLEPYAIIGGFGLFAWVAAAFIWHAINHWRVEHGEAALMLEPWHIITLGLAIAAGGLIWQWRHASPPNPQMAVLQTQVDALKAQLALAKAAPPTTQQSTQKKYFSSDIDARIKAIDRLDTIVAGFQPILMQSQEFWNRIRIMIADGTASKLLTKYETDAQPLLNSLNSALTEYRMRFPELDQAIRSNDYAYVVAIPYAASHLRDEISNWSGQANFIQTIENTKTYDYWDKTIHSVQPWMEKSRQELAKLRQQYASANVYDDEQGNKPSTTQPPQRTGAAVYISPSAVDSGMENVRIQGFDNAVRDDGKSSRIKDLDVKK